MAAAMARGWAAAGRGSSLLFTDAGSGRAAALASELGGEARQTLAALAADAELIVVAVKPKALASVAAELAGGPPLISVLGATTQAQLEAAFPGSAVLRAMPNVAVELRSGIICHVPIGEQPRMLAALEALGELGRLVELPEEQIDAATAVMGCAPAYIALAAGAIATAGTRAGLDPELARSLVADATAGIGKLLEVHDAEQLQRAIASPGGSTEAGLRELAAHEAGTAFEAAVDASLARMAGA